MTLCKQRVSGDGFHNHNHNDDDHDDDNYDGNDYNGGGWAGHCILKTFSSYNVLFFARSLQASPFYKLNKIATKKT